MNNARGYNVLLWVKDELDETICRVRSTLEEYAGGAGEPDLMEFCITGIHQVYGALQMVEIYGAAMLAEEMELVAKALFDGTVKRKGVGTEILMLGLTQLPDHLEKLLEGGSDNPLIILPLLNELRAVRDADLLSEVAIFAPELECRLASEPVEGKGNADLSKIARRLRHSYHNGLLAWYRGVDPRDGIAELRDVLGKMEQSAGTEQVRRLFRVSRAVANLPLEEESGPGIALNLLFGRLDREIKRIIEEGEQAAAESPPLDLLKNFLYYAAATDSDNEALREVKEEFDLDISLAIHREIELGRENLQAPNRVVLESLRDVISADITALQDELDLFIHSLRDDPAQILALQGRMCKILDTLGMAGQGALRQRLKRQFNRIGEIIVAGTIPEEDDLIVMAGDILFVDTCLANQGRVCASTVEVEGAAALGSAAGRASDLATGEYDKLVEAVLHEAGIDIAKSKDAILSYIESPTNTQVLNQVPGLLRSVAGAFEILKLFNALALLRLIAGYVINELIARPTVPEKSHLNAFADAVTSIEYFMETLEGGGGSHDELLDVVRESLAYIGIEDKPDEAKVAAESLPAMEEAIVPASSGTVASVENPLLEYIDPEILDIFIEEAQVELGVICEQIPKWCANQDDVEALTDCRRSFHTLTGSGRLVGADMISEYACSIENLLNRVIDEAVQVNDEILYLLKETLNVLPVLIECQVRGDRPELDIASMMDRAFALAKPKRVAVEDAGEKPEVVEYVAGEYVVTGEDIVAVEEVAEEREQEVVTPQPKKADEQGLIAPIVLDPVLQVIFEEESRTHIDTLKYFLESDDGSVMGLRLIRHDVSRILHTIHGSALMAEVESMAVLGKGLEEYVNEGLKQDGLTDSSLLELMGRAVGQFEAILASINVPGAVLPDWQGLLADITDQNKADIARTEVAEPVIPALGTAVEPAELVEASIDLEAMEEAIEPPEIAADERLQEPPFEETVELSRDNRLQDSGAIPVMADEDLLVLFLEEATELLDALDNTLQEWDRAPYDKVPLKDLQRSLHTLKGGARLVGIMPIGDLIHTFESLLSGVSNGKIRPTPEVRSLSQNVADRLMTQIEEVQAERRVHAADEVVATLKAVLAGEASVESAAGVAQTEEETLPQESGVLEEVPDYSAPVVDTRHFEGEGAGAAGEPSGKERVSSDADAKVVASPSSEAEPGEARSFPVRRIGRDYVRVSPELLDKLVNNSGEISIYRARLEQQSSTMAFNFSELRQTVSRLHNQLRQLEIETEVQILFRYERDKEEQEEQETEEAFDPLEMDRFSTMQQLSRSLMETVSDLSSINVLLDEQHRETDTLLLQQSRVATDLQDGLLRTRMVPFSQVLPRLQRLVRQTCTPLRKQAVLHVSGGEGELDRQILDRMVGPLEHILRNAVSHGIELPEERIAAGKDEIGSIRLELVRDGNDLVITVADDGAGLNIREIRSRAIRLGLLAEGADITDNDLMRFVLEHGFTTVDQLSQVSGRGVGMGIVVSEVKQLGGSLDLGFIHGRGTHFTIRIPLTLAIADAFLLQLGDEIYVAPHTSIEGVVRISRQELLKCYEGRQEGFTYTDTLYPVRYLGSLIGVGGIQLPAQQKWFSILLARSGEHRMALQVDELLGSHQIVVKSVGSQLSMVRWITGGTILGDGRVALILDIAAMLRMDVAQGVVPPEDKLAPGVGRTVMVVDDSITVRKVTSRLLERNGIRAMTARDGVDALAQLQEHHPDLMLLDIEMPRMGGYDLARQMRNSKKLQDIPIIIISSRIGEKHRNIAMNFGVKGYLGKPYQEKKLLEDIYALLAKSENTK